MRHEPPRPGACVGLVMLTVAVFFLLAAIVAAVLGFVAVGPAGLIAAAVFFAVFLWTLASHRRAGRRDAADNPLKGTTRRAGGK
jgi:fatty acid desaturase